MRILNWNTQWLSPRSRGGRFQAARELIAGHQADVICLTEARAELMPSGGQTVASELSGAGTIENRGGRKVVLWSRYGWRKVDALGSPRLPEGRFVRAETEIAGQAWTIVGMCIPYHAYRVGEKWGEQRLATWEGACRYLDALREDLLPKFKHRERVVLLGDFNLQIPPKNYPYPNSEVDRKRQATFARYNIPTSDAGHDPALDKRFIDHIALSHDINVNETKFFSRFHSDGTELSDHNGVCIDVSLDFVYPNVIEAL